MSTIGVIGNAQFALGFRLAGIRNIWETDGSEESIERAVAQARRDDSVSVLVMETRDVRALSQRTRHELVSSVRPTMVAVGTEEDNTLREKIKQAVGVDLW